jgi:hypothetical protein
VFVDFSQVIADKLPLFVGVVVLLSFVLLTMVFRSLVVATVAAAMNLLSAAAAFGVIVAVFQDGIGLELIGVDRTGPILAFLPVILFAILFGLSMDYEVFLLSRVHEEWLHRGDNREAVKHGLAATGRTITAAAAIMVMLFLAFVLGTGPHHQGLRPGPARRGAARRGGDPQRPGAGRHAAAGPGQLVAARLAGPGAAAPVGEGPAAAGRRRRCARAPGDRAGQRPHGGLVRGRRAARGLGAAPAGS